MAPEAGSFLPDEAELLSRLWLNATDAARVCGITVRQLTYWTDRGIIQASGGETRTYSLSALRKTVSFKRVMLGGYTLEKAAQLIESNGDGVMAGEPRLSLAYLDSLLDCMQVWSPRVPALLALGRLRRAAAAVGSLDWERCFAGSEDTEAAVETIARILNDATANLEQSVLSLARPVVLQREDLAESTQPLAL